ncbi:uncharacterized protein [Chironomus tepperi]|uniref:uncharacterized protein isoform X2 n=1 Tax=Chironomus tepperi TaxID=113505 RepID=UPI00391FBABC
MQPAKRFKSDNYTVHDVVDMELEGPEPALEPEPKTFFEVLSFTYTTIESELLQTITDLTDFETLEVNDIPDIPTAVNLISSDLLRQKFYQTSYSIAIRLKVIDKITTLSPLQYEIISTKIDKARKFLLCLESLSDKKCCFYWKSADETRLMSLSLIDVDIMDRDSMICFINSFLLLALRFGNDGLSQEAKFTSSTDLSLFSLADVNDKNLLMLASELGNKSVVEDLIRIGFDVNFQVDTQIAADLAWQNRHLDVLLSLLLENSLYPMNFNESNTSNEMKEFVKMTHQFVKSVKNNDEVTVKNILEKYPNLRYFYSRDNVSAAFVALSKEKFDIYKIFMNKNVCVGPKEDIDKILSNFNDKKREELRKIHLEHSREPPEKFLMILHSNTSVGHDTINVNEKLNHAKSAIEYLCRISIIRLILQVVAASRDFKLIFDFNRDSVQFLDPTSSKQTRGSFFTSRQIYIAAKFFLDPQRRQEAIGTLAHELCHFAMFLVYKNNCLPYFNGDHKQAKKFHGYLKFCHENRKKEKIIHHVFDIPKENQETRHAELIVRVPHLLALYHEDQDYLDQLREIYLPLFSFFEFKVVEDMKTALPNIETEADGEIRKFNDKRKRKGFFRMRNIILLLIIASIAVIGIILGVYFAILSSHNNDIVGDVKKPWNAIIRHSRTDEIMCIGSLIHPEFVLTTAECVQKKSHRIPLPPALFVVDFHPIEDHPLRSNVIEVNVHSDWRYNEDNFESDLSLLKLEQPLQFFTNFYPINLPPQLQAPSSASDRNGEVLHTIHGLHSFNIPIVYIDTIECILKDYTINRYLGDQQYCARQLENHYCINGYGEQLYDLINDTLNGLVSMGHKTEADCVDHNSLIITEVGYYSDSIRNAICGERSSTADNIWMTESMIYDFMVAVVEKSSNQFLCWSFFVNKSILLTDSNCIESLSKNDIQLSRYGNVISEIDSIEQNPNADITKIILTSNSTLDVNLDIPKFDAELQNLQNVKIIYSYENILNFTSRYYQYQKDFNHRVLSTFCVPFSGGPIFTNYDSVSFYGIVTKRRCKDNCNIEDNGFIVDHVKLYDYKDWIYDDPTTHPDRNLIEGDIADQEYCINTECSLIPTFKAASFKIHHIDASYYIAARPDDNIKGIECEIANQDVKSLPIDLVDIYPNLISYKFSFTGVKEISFDNFQNLTALEVIELSDNEIETIQSDTFNHTSSLRRLNLNGNKIVTFNENILMKIQNLETLLIGSNLLKNNVNFFKFCSSLKEVQLSKNEISEILDNIFLNCSSIEIIDLNSNEISSLNPVNFLNKPNLMSVDLTVNICIDKLFVGTNGSTFATDELNSMINEISLCGFDRTSTTVAVPP